MKKIWTLIFLVLYACTSTAPAPEQTSQVSAATEEAATPSPTTLPTDTPQPSATPTNTPTLTLTPTETLTPTPSPTPVAGGSGYVIMIADLNVVTVSVKDPNDYNVVLSASELVDGLEIAEISSLRSHTVSPMGDIVALWNCATKICDTMRGSLYLFSTDFEQKTTIEVPGYPAFIGWSAEQDYLLYYLGSTMADDYYLIKAKQPDFGKVISLGRLTDVSWAHDRQSLYAQKGSTVYHLDLDGDELETFTCDFNDDCMHAPSPDGKRFAGIQKHVPTNKGNPVITISNQDFSEKKSLFLKDDKALIISVMWLPDNQHLVVYGMTARQRTRRFWRLDYLSVIDVESGEERVIQLDVPEDSESFTLCGLSPDGTHVVYLGTGGRVKEEGRIMMSGRSALFFPLWSDHPELERMTLFDGAWEDCPVWLYEVPAITGPQF
ncbi:MAG: hypothetical protein JXA78_11445 [Anaerolineales bacterium]|nr:hypothetical protein [Anaerolineales bacterium]